MNRGELKEIVKGIEAPRRQWENLRHKLEDMEDFLYRALFIE